VSGAIDSCLDIGVVFKTLHSDHLTGETLTLAIAAKNARQNAKLTCRVGLVRIAQVTSRDGCNLHCEIIDQKNMEIPELESEKLR
jgi:hypothetical protein